MWARKIEKTRIVKNFFLHEKIKWKSTPPSLVTKEERRRRKMPLANKEVVHLKNGWEKIQVRK